MCNTQNRFKALISACVMSLIATAGWSQSLTWLGTLGGNISSARDVSADGSVVVGVARGSNGFYRPFRWTPGGRMQDLGTLGGRHGVATRVSPNGATIVGTASTVNSSDSASIDSVGFLSLNNNHRYHPFRWTQGSGMQDLGTFGGCCGWGNSVSADGGVVVGWAYNASGQLRAYRWENNQMRDLGTLGGAESAARGVSADGGVVVGWALNASGNRRAYRWENNQMRDLGTLGGAESEARGVSANGRVVVGRAQNASGQWRAFRWENDQMRDLGTLGGAESDARGVSANGRVVVGWAYNASGQWRAFRWTENGIEDLSQTYANLLSGGSYFIAAHEVSEDGRYIVGYGYNAARGRNEGFLLDTWRVGDTNGDGCVDDADLLAVLFAFGSAGTGDTRHEDINKDGIVDDADLLQVLFNFGSGC
jgi:probable HAF family extracellular repeat protein